MSDFDRNAQVWGAGRAQQTSAVEQVNLAIASVAQTTRETEVSSQQTLETVSQLASLSRDLRQLVQPPTAV